MVARGYARCASLHPWLQSVAAPRLQKRSLLPNAIQVSAGAEEEVVANNGGLRHETFVESVLGYQVVIGTGVHHEDFAHLVAEVHVWAGLHRRGRELAIEPLAPQYLAIGRIQARRDTVVRHHEQQLARNQKRRPGRYVLVPLPRNRGIRHSAAQPLWVQRKQLLGVPTVEVHLAVGHHGSRGAVHAAVREPPQFRAGQWIVSYVSLRKRAYEILLSTEREQRRRGISLLVVAVIGAVLDLPVHLPLRFAARLLQRDHVLLVEAIEDEVEQLAVSNRRGTGAAEVVALQIGAFPEHLSARGVDAKRP